MHNMQLNRRVYLVDDDDNMTSQSATVCIFLHRSKAHCARTEIVQPFVYLLLLLFAPLSLLMVVGYTRSSIGLCRLRKFCGFLCSFEQYFLPNYKSFIRERRWKEMSWKTRW